MIDLGAELADFSDDQPRRHRKQKRSREAREGPFVEDITTMRTSDDAAAKARRRKITGRPKHKIRMVPLDDPHAQPRVVYPDWL